MPLAYQQIQSQIRALGEAAVARQHELQGKRQKAQSLFDDAEAGREALRAKIMLVAGEHDPNLRCALPVEESQEALNGAVPCPPPLAQGTIIAADGSQINPDRHAEVNYCLVNVGAIRMAIGSAASPITTVRSQLLHDEQLYTAGGVLTDATVALLRDLKERSILAELSAEAEALPVVTFTDGPLELWGSREPGGESEFQKRLNEYHTALSRLRDQQVATAGYVDKPGANLVVRMLEVSMAAQEQLPAIREYHPLRGVSDLDLFGARLGAGERSAVYALQSSQARQYRGDLALHFFYLNTGAGQLARVEIPAWVAYNPALLEALHSVLVGQCEIIGGRAYPYLLHRAHEVAVVSRDEKEQLTGMILQELRRRGLAPGRKSEKQATKDLPGRRRI
jgi:hypothetical protein